MNKRNLAFGRTNFVLLAIGFAIVVVGFVLMGGVSSSETAFEADIFSARRIKVAPVVCFIGFVSMIYAVIHKPKDVADDLPEAVGHAAPAETAAPKAAESPAVEAAKAVEAVEAPVVEVASAVEAVAEKENKLNGEEA